MWIVSATKLGKDETYVSYLLSVFALDECECAHKSERAVHSGSIQYGLRKRYDQGVQLPEKTTEKVKLAPVQVLS